MSKDYEVYYGGVYDYTVFTVDDDTSDGYHTFGELYEHRLVLTSLVVNLLETLDPGSCFKSRSHDDGTMFEGMFIVGVKCLDGTYATYHYDDTPENWNMFSCEELPFAPKWDGSTPDNDLRKLKELSLAITSGKVLL